ncbi:MAG TPA: hypothetical protein VGO64_07020 [Candidatus Limnocylindrales bacterium]|nr:hypothetical protein [Candidatus Limnocylindrales bacterium]
MGDENEPSGAPRGWPEDDAPESARRGSVDMAGTWDPSLAVFDATAGFIVAEDARTGAPPASRSIFGERRLDAERAEMIGRVVAIVILIIAVALIVFGPIREF